ncbi:MAG: hypothetical protein NVSMB31_03420 [Vulcanimicrobiaceae bacterium]
MKLLFKLSVNIPLAHARRLKKLRADCGLSASSVVEVALSAYFDGVSDAVVAARAKKAGANLRREAPPDD